MKRITRKLLSALLCAAMLLSVVGGTASFVSAEEHDHEHEAAAEAAEASVEAANGGLTVEIDGSKCTGTKYCLPLNIIISAPEGIETLKVNGTEVTVTGAGGEAPTEYTYYATKAGADGRLTVEASDTAGHTVRLTEELGSHNLYNNGRLIRTYHGSTCTEDGYEAISSICLDCGFENEIIQPGHRTVHSGHKWEKQTLSCNGENPVEAEICTVCGVIKNPGVLTGHNWAEEVVTEPTCDKAGETTKTCLTCGLKIKLESTRSLGHWVDLYSYTKTPCEGVWQYKCFRPGCDYGYTRYSRISDHEYTGGNDCTQPKQCVKCGKLSTEKAPYENHEWSEAWTELDENSHAHKCVHDGCEQVSGAQDHVWSAVESGSCESGLRCSVCGYVKTSGTQHNFGGQYYSDGNGCHYQKCLNPGCSAESEHRPCTPGADDSDCTTPVYCTLCKAVTKAGEAGHRLAMPASGGITSLGHRLYCSNPGCSYNIFEAHKTENDDHDCTTALVCDVCKFVLIAASNGHHYDKNSWTGDDTGHWRQCTNEGCQSRTDFSAHTANLYEILSRSNPDCTNSGWLLKTKFCRTCHRNMGTEREEIPPLGHEWGEWEEIVPAECGKPGTKQHECSRCGETETDVIPALEHRWSEWTHEIPATCTAAGTDKRTCELCNEVEEKTVEALGHSWADTPTVDKAATCTEPGSKSVHCTRCDAKTKQETIPAAGHTWGQWTTEKPATCTEDGLQKHTCDVCGESETKSITAVGHHTWGEWTTEKPATCTEDGLQKHTCDVCGESETEPITAVGHHTWGEWTTEKPATCTEDGLQKHTCDVCGESETKPIAAVGHSYDEHGFCTDCGAVASETEHTGDVDRDGDLDMQDALAALRWILGTGELDEEQRSAADYNGDGELTLSDVLLIMRSISIHSAN